MSQTDKTPVVLFVYNRPEHTRKTLCILDVLPEAINRKIYIFSDNAKNEKAQASVQQVRALIDEYAVKSRFAEVEIYKAEKNQGLASSIINGVSAVIRKHGSVIVLEDDLEVAPDFLAYMDQALSFYQNKEMIWAISGYTFPLKAFENYDHDIYMSGRGCSWGWATWKDRWDTVDWEVKDYALFKYNWKKRHSFAQWGADMPTMLDACVMGKINSWAIRWCYAAFKQRKWTVYPVKSRIANHGTDGSGTNFSYVENKYDTALNTECSKVNFEMINADAAIRKEFARKYISMLGACKSELKWLLYKTGIRNFPGISIFKGEIE